MSNWDDLISGLHVEEVKAVQPPVDVPDKVVEMLTKLRTQTGPNGGKLRASLPTKSMEDANNIRRTLRAAGDKLVPPASVTTKFHYAMEDEEAVSNDKGEIVLKVKDGAVPVHITFTVGERRGKKSDKTAEKPAEAVEKPAEKPAETSGRARAKH